MEKEAKKLEKERQDSLLMSQSLGEHEQDWDDDLKEQEID